MLAPLRRGARRLSGVGPVLAAAGLVAVLLAALLAGERPGPALAASVAAVLVARAADLQRPRLGLSVVEDLPGLFVAVAAATLTLAGVSTPSLGFAALSLAALVLAHTSVYAATRLRRRSDRRRRRVLVVGTGATARRLAVTLMTRPELGLEPTGFVGAGHEITLAQARGLPLALVGPVSGLPRAMSEARVDAVVVALAGPAGDDEVAALDGLLASSAEVYAVPGWLPGALSHTRHPAELVDGVPVVHLHRRGSWPPVRLLKRSVEVLVALATLSVLLPAAAVLALLVWVETGGVLVRLQRIDLAGRTTSAARFRTRRSRWVARRGTTFSVAVPGRLGPVGHLLRRTRLDALPELVATLWHRVQHAGGVSPGLVLGTAAAPERDEPQVDASQLTR